MLIPSDEQKNTNAGSDAMSPPGNCSLTTEGMDLLIHRHWGRYAGVKNVAWGIVFTGLILWFYKVGGASPLFEKGLFSIDSLAVIVFGGSFFTLGLYFLVLGIYQIVDSTIIRVNTNSVSTQHHPLPWRTQSFPSSNIKQVFVTFHQAGYLIGENGRDRQTGRRMDYAVNLLMSDGSQQQLVRQLPRSDQAHFIEAQIEKRLGIKDARVKDEYSL